jgi:hypothetical protein
MRPLLFAVLLLGACGKPKAAVPTVAAPDAAPPVVAPVTTVPTQPAGQPSTTRAGARPQLRLTLRSTPTGATVAVDGLQVGVTPVQVDVDQDGKIHELTFVLSGFALERIKFAPVRDGVVHATMKPVRLSDAGP